MTGVAGVIMLPEVWDYVADPAAVDVVGSCDWFDGQVIVIFSSIEAANRCCDTALCATPTPHLRKCRTASPFELGLAKLRAKIRPL